MWVVTGEKHPMVISIDSGQLFAFSFDQSYSSCLHQYLDFFSGVGGGTQFVCSNI